MGTFLYLVGCKEWFPSGRGITACFRIFAVTQGFGFITFILKSVLSSIICVSWPCRLLQSFFSAFSQSVYLGDAPCLSSNKTSCWILVLTIAIALPHETPVWTCCHLWTVVILLESSVLNGNYFRMECWGLVALDIRPPFLTFLSHAFRLSTNVTFLPKVVLEFHVHSNITLPDFYRTTL